MVLHKRYPAALLLLLPVVLFARQSPAQHIGQRTVTYTDSARHRPLVTELWYPTSEGVKKTDSVRSPFTRDCTVRNGRLPGRPVPLILLSHGTGGDRLTLEWLAKALVKKGFMVAAVDHWGNTGYNKVPLMFFEFWQRPRDLSFVLSALMKDPVYSRVIDTARVGAAGFSIGGYTVIALAGAVADLPTMITYYKTAGHKEIEFPEFPGLNKMLDDSTLLADGQLIPPLKDSRIKAFFSICPGLGPGFTDKRQLAAIGQPVFIIGAQADSMAPVVHNARHYHEMIPSSGYFEFPGRTGHYVMLNEAIDEVKKSDPIYFADDGSVNRKAVHEKVGQLAGAFFVDKLK